MTHDAQVEAVVDSVAELLRVRIGLRPESTLQGRLRRGIRDEALARREDPDAYYTMLASTPGALQSLVNRVTVHETAFFRHPEHFDVLVNEILPGLPQPVKIWSAGCSNGQEAFTIAMLLEEQRIAGSVIATDLSTIALERTAAAQYAARELTGLSPERIERHLTPHGQGWRINDSLRARVTTLHHNLVNPVPDQARSSQIVFCRNVLIYFAPDHARAFVDRLTVELPRAVVFLGSAEAMWPISHRYETVRTGDTFYYRKRSTDTAPAFNDPRVEATRPDQAGVRERDRPRPTGATVVRPIPAVSAPIPAVPLAAPVAAPPVGGESPHAEAAILSRAGQRALGIGDYASAVVAFRKCSYLAPEDPVAHVQLGLALEASGDLSSARRAFRAARFAVHGSAVEHVENAIGGYATTELIRLLDTKRQVLGA